MLKKSALLLMLATAPAAAQAATPSPGWKAFADCAAAYRANSEIRDPNRAPSMKAQIADQADVYAKAALRPYRKAVKSTPPAASAAVTSYVARRTEDFARQEREAIERFIDACPQPDQ